MAKRTRQHEGTHLISAFTVADEHIHVLVTAGLNVPYRPFRWHLPQAVERIDATANNGLEYSVGRFGGYATRVLRRESASAVGQMLLDQNVANVNCRYREDDLRIYTYVRSLRTHREPVEILKAVHCYEYQACETEDWAHTKAHAYCRALERVVIGQLSGYDEAAWEITTTTPTLSEERQQSAG